jgi:hypothetical protein
VGHLSAEPGFAVWPYPTPPTAQRWRAVALVQVLGVAVLKLLIDFSLRFDSLIQRGGMQQPTSHLLGRKRRQPGPLEAVLRQPQLRIRRVDPAVTGLWVGDEDAAGADPVLGYFLRPAPQALADH